MEHSLVNQRYLFYKVRSGQAVTGLSHLLTGLVILSISLPPDPRDQLGLRCLLCERPDTTVLFVLCLHRHHPRHRSGHHILSVTRLDELLIPAISFNKSMSTHIITISFSGLNKTFFRRSEMSKLTINSNYFIEKTFRAEIYLQIYCCSLIFIYNIWKIIIEVNEYSVFLIYVICNECSCMLIIC